MATSCDQFLVDDWPLLFNRRQSLIQPATVGAMPSTQLSRKHFCCFMFGFELIHNTIVLISGPDVLWRLFISPTLVFRVRWIAPSYLAQCIVTDGTKKRGGSHRCLSECTGFAVYCNRVALSASSLWLLHIQWDTRNEEIMVLSPLQRILSYLRFSL